MNTPSFTTADIMHRLVKQAIDSGLAQSVEQANAIFYDYRLCLSIDPDQAGRQEHQAALLTSLALARRVFLGGVWVEGVAETPLSVPLPLGDTLAEAIITLGGIVAPCDDGLPLITIGGAARQRRKGFHVRTAAAGWRGGIVPGHSEMTLGDLTAMPLASMLAAALAVNEAFLHVSGGSPAAGRRTVGLSLWKPDQSSDWMKQIEEPRVIFLPSHLWLIGLGHLGQAFLWGLGLLQYADPSAVSLVLQDIDLITPSTESTSVLTDASLVGQMKTRAMARWAERRGFRITIVERAFDASFRRQPNDPAIALCGIDNALGRRALDGAGFDMVVEAGLGRGHRDFRSIRMHTLPGTRTAGDIWKAVPGDEQDVADRPAYHKMLSEGELDRCGVTLLAGKAVGAPFVGAVAACLALSEVLRLLHGGQLYQLIDIDLESVEHRTTVRHAGDFTRLNPGYAAVSAGSGREAENVPSLAGSFH